MQTKYHVSESQRSSNGLGHRYAGPVLFLLILGAGLWVRLYAVAGESAWCDEVLTLTCLPAHSLRAFLRCAFETDPVPEIVPVYYAAEYAWSRLFGGGLPEMRLLSVAAGLGSLTLVFLLGKLLYGARAGRVAMAGLAMSPTLTYYDQEVRFYAFLVLFGLVAMYGFTRAIQTGRARWWALHGFGNALLLWTHAFAPALFVGQGFYLLAFHWRRWRLWLAWGAGHVFLLAGFLAWMLLLGYDFGTHSQTYSDVPPDWRDLAATWLIFAGGRFSELDPALWLPGGISFDEPLGLFALVLLLWAGWSAWRGHRGGPEPTPEHALAPTRKWGLLLCWLLAPPLFLFFASHVWKPCYLFRYVLFSLPALWLALAAGLQTVRPAALRALATGLLLCLVAYQNLALPRPLRPDYRSAAEMVKGTEAPCAVHALKLFNGLGMEYALSGAEPVRFIEGFPELCAAASESARSGKTTWAVFYRWSNFAPFEDTLRAENLSFERHTLGGLPPLIVYRVDAARIATSIPGP